MKNEATEESKLDEQSITKAAAAALSDLQLDTEVKSVNADGDRWCVQFKSEYNQFCDTFRDQFGKENSFELVREKIKRSLLKQQQNKIRSSVRIRRGKTEQRRPSSDNLLQTALKTIEGAVGQTAEVAGEIIKQVSSLPEQASEILTDAAGGLSGATAPLQSGQGVDQPLMRIRVKPAAKSTRKNSRSARQAASKKSTAKKAAKKASVKSKKRTPAKATSKAAKKRASTKSSKKSR